MSKTTECAVAMLAALRAAEGQQIYSDDLRQAVTAAGADSEYIHAAAKYLRDIGVPLASKKARHRSYYVITTNVGTLDEWVNRVRREHLSEGLSQACSMYEASRRSPKVRALRNDLVGSLVRNGAELGMDAEEVLALCVPRAAEQVG